MYETESILCHRRLSQTSVRSGWGSLLGWILAERSSMNHDGLLQNRCPADIPPVGVCTEQDLQYSLLGLLLIYHY